MKVIALAILSVGFAIDISFYLNFGGRVSGGVDSGSVILESLVSMIAAIMVLFYKEK